MRLKLIIFISFILIFNAYSQVTLPENLVYFYIEIIDDQDVSYFYSPDQIYLNNEYVSFVMYSSSSDSTLHSQTVTIDCKRDILKIKVLGSLINDEYTILKFSPLQEDRQISYIEIEFNMKFPEDRVFFRYMKYKFCEQ
jgi:hypothetical protein